MQNKTSELRKLDKKKMRQNMQELQKVHGNEITFILVPKFFQIYA